VLPGLEVTPWPYQTEILEALAAERLRHDRWRNLVISPTGTGKTVVAALDYRRLHQLDSALARTPTLLFVAHRQEILRQSLATFRAVLNDHSFGELFVDGQQPSAWQHVFASVQSLSTARMRDEDLSRFDVVIVDEFHHAEAATYQRLLERVDPRLLLGMTATPERTDGVDVRRWFDDRAAFEMRLWDALDQRLLSPFQYFGVGEDVDLSALTWRRGAYATEELSNLLTGNDMRVRHVLRQVSEIVEDPRSMRALGFCVSVAHAEFMAQRFNEAGIVAEAITGETPSEARADAIRGLRAGEVQVLFTVDLFNEGFDVPEIDTVLFLRPTESATLFLQQLGRGLRKAESKACLTVLDFIGRQHQEFRFDLRFRALTGRSRRQVEQDLEEGFPLLPSGCSIQLDRVAQEIVLSNVRQQLKNTSKTLIREAQRLAGEVEHLSLGTFLEETGLAIDDFYASAKAGWTGLQRAAGLPLPEESEGEEAMARNIGNLLHLDDPERLQLLREPEAIAAGIAAESGYRYRLARQILTTVGGEQSTVADPAGAARKLLAAKPVVDELREVATILEDRSRRLVTPLATPAGVPISVHATYTRAEIAEAFGFRARGWVTGVRYVEEMNTDLLMVTLRKSETHQGAERQVRVPPEQPLELVADRGFDRLDGMLDLVEEAAADPGYEHVCAAQRRVDVVGPQQRHAGQQNRALGLADVALDLEDPLASPRVAQVDGQPVGDRLHPVPVGVRARARDHRQPLRFERPCREVLAHVDGDAAGHREQLGPPALDLGVDRRVAVGVATAGLAPCQRVLEAREEVDQAVGRPCGVSVHITCRLLEQPMFHFGARVGEHRRRRERIREMVTHTLGEQRCEHGEHLPEDGLAVGVPGDHGEPVRRFPVRARLGEVDVQVQRVGCAVGVAGERQRRELHLGPLQRQRQCLRVEPPAAEDAGAALEQRTQRPLRRVHGARHRRRLDELGGTGDDRLELPLGRHGSDLTEQHVPQRLDIEQKGQRHRVLLGLLRPASVLLRLVIAAPHGIPDPQSLVAAAPAADERR
jgi:superfamily II DNA or RNA helicase